MEHQVSCPQSFPTDNVWVPFIQPFHALSHLTCTGEILEWNLEWHACYREGKEGFHGFIQSLHRIWDVSVSIIMSWPLSSKNFSTYHSLLCSWNKRTCDRSEPQPMWTDEQQDGESDVQKSLLPAVQPQHSVPAPINRTELVPAWMTLRYSTSR